MIEPGDVVRVPGCVGVVRMVSSYGIWLFFSGHRFDHATAVLVAKHPAAL